MTVKADFSPEDWDVIAEGPPTAGMIVSTAQRGGTFREAIAMGKAYSEARREHGASALLDELVSGRPEMQKPHARTPEELREQGLGRIREAVRLLEQKATPAEVEDYRRFVISLANRVAAAKSEGGDQAASEAEAAAIGEITRALGPAAAA
jgi:hypothetical protein